MILSGAFSSWQRETVQTMEAEMTYTTTVIFIWFNSHCTQTKRNELYFECIRRHILISRDKNAKDLSSCTCIWNYLAFGIRLLRQVRTTSSSEYGPESALEFYIQYSFLKAPIRDHFHIFPLYAKLYSQIWLFEVWSSNIRTQPGISNTIV